ncbi:MAG: AbrB/MazE/SpoVT family DNA-binding domain-containing protein [Chloroflexi bacterium]|nr:AbrB/MazE/SpoVT family DNA-binding domain-containing protein [Chloroflexota bacterium]
MQAVTVKLDKNGRLVLPIQFRRALGFEPGDELILALDQGELRIFTRGEAVKRAQELVRRYIPSDRSLVDELIQERRAESARE